MFSLISRGAAPSERKDTAESSVQVQNTSYVGVSPFIVQDDFDYSHERLIAKTQNTAIGIKPMTKEEAEADRALGWQVMKKFTWGIFSLDFSNFCFPVSYCGNRTFIERTSDLFAFLATEYLDKAAGTSIPEKRLEFITVGIVAGFHLYIQSKKPWNPVLGETFKGKWPNGAVIYAEQISHHPPLSAFQIESPEKKWSCDATCSYTVSSGVFQIDIGQTGAFHLVFEDGSEYEWEFPTITINGVLKGDRIITVKGPLIVKDLTNSLQFVVDIALKDNESKGINNARATSIYGEMTKVGAKKVKSIISGDYAEKIAVNGQDVWSIDKNTSQRASSSVEDWELLQSDSRFRLDRKLLMTGNVDSAERAKHLIEEMQRREEKMREIDNE